MNDLFDKITSKHKKIKSKRQVRFFIEADLYNEFKSACNKHGLFMQDVFKDMMQWFILEHNYRDHDKQLEKQKHHAEKLMKDLTNPEAEKLDPSIGLQDDKEVGPSPGAIHLMDLLTTNIEPTIPFPPIPNRPIIPPPPPEPYPWPSRSKPYDPTSATCSQCGMEWKGAMMYCCPSNDCPMQMKVTC